MTQNNTPLEEEEQVAFVDYLYVCNLKFSSIPNSTWTTSWNQKLKNQKLGLHKGLPDLLIYIPAHRSIQNKNCLIFVEMKRQKGGTPSPDQIAWINVLNSVDNVECCITKGCAEAINFLHRFLIIK